MRPAEYDTGLEVQMAKRGLPMSGCCGPRPNLQVDDEHMAEHKCKIGSMFFYPRSREIEVPRDRPFQIVQRLPLIDGQFQYKIRIRIKGALGKALFGN